MGLKIIVLSLLTVLLGSTGHATPVVGVPVTWNGVGADPLGWGSIGGSAVVAASPVDGNPNGYLQIQFDFGGFPGVDFDSVANGDGGYTGDYSSLVLSFDYLGFGANSLQSLYFKSAVGDSTWEYVFSTPSASWESLSISFNTLSGWTSTNIGVSFQDAITNVSLLGFSVRTPFDSTGLVTFGVDNLEFNSEQIAAPEPSAILLLVSVLLCLGVTFRVDRFLIRPKWMKQTPKNIPD
jgi:hypothetical protein